MATPEQQAAALARRTARFETRIEYLGHAVERGLTMGLAARVRVCAQLVRDKTVINLSTPVRKIRGERTRNRSGRFQSVRTRVDPTSRSRPGGFPHADTTRLMKDVYYEVTATDGLTARVGTTLDYGLVLETVLNRSFLRRTLDELRPQITRILTAPAGGGGPTAMRNRG